MDNEMQALQPENGTRTVERRADPGELWLRTMLGLALGLLLGCLVTCGILTSAHRQALQRYRDSIPGAEDLRAVADLMDRYFMGDADRQEQVDAMLKAYVAADGDRYSRYYTTSEYAAEVNSRAGKTAGIGITVAEGRNKDGIAVLWVSKDSPADAAGLQAGDLLTEVGAQSYGELGYADFVEALRGEVGSELRLGFQRDGKPMEVTLTRADYIATTVVAGTVANGRLGLIRIVAFDEPTTEQFADAIEEMKNAGVEGLIFDVRGNPGGLLDVVVEMLDRLLPEGIIATTRGKSGEKVYRSDAEQLELPMAVLCNGETASAAELFTAALRDYEKSVTVGTTTFGKGIAQSTYLLDDGSAVKMTTSYYDPPSGVNYDGVGITPDLEVQLPEALATCHIFLLGEEEDTQLAAAIDALLRPNQN